MSISFWGRHHGRVNRNVCFSARGHKFNSKVVNKIYLNISYGGVKVSRQANLKYSIVLTNLIAIFVVVTKKPFLTLQHLKIFVACCVWV